MLEVVVASSNRSKIEEIAAVFGGLGVKLLTKKDVRNWPGDVEETGETYLANALLKARAVSEATGKAALADDSGIEVDALDGAPGPRSARFAGEAASDEENNRRLAELLEGVPEEQRTARYRCVAVIISPDGAELAALGTCEGSIATQPRGEGGFGYDPWFIPAGGSRTMAELRPEEKHAISHRGKALRGLAGRLRLELDVAGHESSP